MKSFVHRIVAVAFLVFTAINSTRADYASTVSGYSPLAYWRFNETVATPPLNTVSNFGSLGSTANGYAVNGAIKGEAGIVGSSVRFTNPANAIEFSGSKIDVPFNAPLNSAPPFSIEFWPRVPEMC